MLKVGWKVCCFYYKEHGMGWHLSSDMETVRFRPASKKEFEEDGRLFRPMSPVEKIHFRLDKSNMIWRVCKVTRKGFTGLSISRRKLTDKDWTVLSSGDSKDFFF